jgi:hypothetical protein
MIQQSQLQRSHPGNLNFGSQLALPLVVNSWYAEQGALPGLPALHCLPALPALPRTVRPSLQLRERLPGAANKHRFPIVRCALLLRHRARSQGPQ